jgi:tetratricopeptide (TPR) repeat protein
MWRGKGGEALEAGRRAVTLDPNDADARVYLSLILHALGRAKEGLQYVRSAIRLNPHPSTFYLFALGVNYSGLGQYEEAVAAFIQGKELNPDFSPNYALLATNSLRFGRTEEALAAWRTFLTLAGGRPPPNSLLVEPQRSDFAADLAELERLNRR